MGPQNVPGDFGGFGTEIPETQADERAFLEMQKTAKFSRTAEFKELKAYLEGRMEYYKTYLPNGKPVVGETNMAELGYLWLTANAVIGEFKMVINAYESAAQAVKDESTRRKTT